MKHDQPWQISTLIAFDLETTGKYPFGADICEIAAVKWRDGEIVDSFQTLVRPRSPMSPEVIKIHNITNEMVEDAPTIGAVLKGFHDFIQDGFMVAHHAPFDLGFMTLEFEKAKLPLPSRPVFCSCLLARRIFPDFENHRLQTLVKNLRIDPGQAHRALDDAKACLYLTLKCFEKHGVQSKMTDLLEIQGGDIDWSHFSIQTLRSHVVLQKVIEALDKKVELQITYAGGSRPGEARTVKPVGLVRSLDDDFLVAYDSAETLPKRYFLKKITAAVL